MAVVRLCEKRYCNFALCSNQVKVLSIVFNAADSDRDNWFAKSRLIHSPWNDLSTEPQIIKTFSFLETRKQAEASTSTRITAVVMEMLDGSWRHQGKPLRLRPGIPTRSSCTVNLLLASTGMITVRSVTLFNSHLRRIELAFTVLTPTCF